MRRSAIVLVPMFILALVIGTIACDWEVGTIACDGEEGEAEGTPTIPNAPSGLTATAQTFSMIVLRWQDNSDNEDKFIIMRRTAGGKTSLIASVGADVTSYRDTGLSEEITYYYRVGAYNDAGASYSNEDSAKTPISIPEYHTVGISVQGQKQSLSIVAVWKTDRYCTYLEKCLAPPGTVFITVALSITNHHSDILIVKRNDFILRDSATRDRYALFEYPVGVGGLLGEPLPKERWLSEGQTVSGVVVYSVPETVSLSEIEVVYILDHKEHVWQP